MYDGNVEYSVSISIAVFVIQNVRIECKVTWHINCNLSWWAEMKFFSYSINLSSTFQSVIQSLFDK